MSEQGGRWELQSFFFLSFCLAGHEAIEFWGFSHVAARLMRPLSVFFLLVLGC